MSVDFGESISSFVVTVGLSTVVGLSLVPGQVELRVRRLDGSTLEIGGASVQIGNGFMLQTLAESVFHVTGQLYAVAGGTQSILAVTRVISNRSFSG